MESRGKDRKLFIDFQISDPFFAMKTHSIEYNIVHQKNKFLGFIWIVTIYGVSLHANRKLDKTMAEGQTNVRTRVRQHLQEPKMYMVVMHNDDFTTMEFVVKVLRTVFHKNEIEAQQLMLTVHRSEKATVGIYTYDIAQSKAQKAMGMARAEGFPFKLTVEVDDPLSF